MLVAYFDDSRYSYEDARFGSLCVIAGYVAQQEVWETEFIPRWTAALKGAPHPISEFKTSNCRQRTGEFAGWTREECDSLTKALVDIITDQCPPKSLHGVSAVVELPDVHGYETYAFLNAFWLTTVLATAVGAHHGRVGDEMKFIFDRQPGREGQMATELEQALDWATALSMRRGLDPLPLRTSPDFADSRIAVPLQAADLLAYETYKELKGRHALNARPASRALERLVEGQTHVALCLDPYRIFINQRVESLGWEDEFEPAAPLFMSGVPLRADWLYPNARLELRFLHRLRYDTEEQASEAAAGWSKKVPAVDHLVVQEADRRFRVTRELDAALDGTVMSVFRAGEQAR
jgi:hypothetical protein